MASTTVAVFRRVATLLLSAMYCPPGVITFRYLLPGRRWFTLTRPGAGCCSGASGRWPGAAVALSCARLVRTSVASASDCDVGTVARLRSEAGPAVQTLASPVGL